jgi:hypothetical protein
LSTTIERFITQGQGHPADDRKTEGVTNTSGPTILNLSGKNTTANVSVTVDSAPLEDVPEFIYLGNNAITFRDCDKDIDAKISKANPVFTTFKPMHVEEHVSVSACTPRPRSPGATSRTCSYMDQNAEMPPSRNLKCSKICVQDILP